MKGIVRALNPSMGRVGCQTSDGFSMFDMMGDDPPDLGDEIEWSDLTPLGGERVRNVTQGCTYDVFFEDHHMSWATLKQQMGG